MTTMLLLHFGNKDLEKIQQKVTYTKGKNFIKQTVGVIADLALMAKKKLPERAENSKSVEKCFNCTKKNDYAKDYHFFLSTSYKKKVEKSTKEAKRSWWKRN